MKRRMSLLLATLNWPSARRVRLSTAIHRIPVEAPTLKEQHLELPSKLQRRRAWSSPCWLEESRTTYSWIRQKVQCGSRRSDGCADVRLCRHFCDDDRGSVPRRHSISLSLPHIAPSFQNLRISLLESNGGEGGIRTHVRVSPKHAFQACAFSHSATSPDALRSL